MAAEAGHHGFPQRGEQGGIVRRRGFDGGDGEIELRRAGGERAGALRERREAFAPSGAADFCQGATEGVGGGGFRAVVFDEGGPFAARDLDAGGLGGFTEWGVGVGGEQGDVLGVFRVRA
jgi:hypothetical protein